MLIRRAAVIAATTAVLVGAGSAAHARPVPPVDEDAGLGLCRPGYVLVVTTCLPDPLGFPLMTMFDRLANAAR